MKVANKIWRDERGATALEFAILAPVFFLIIFGIIAFGLLFWTQVGLQHGAEMAARCASINLLCVPKIRFCNIDGECRQGQVVRRRRRGA